MTSTSGQKTVFLSPPCIELRIQGEQPIKFNLGQNTHKLGRNSKWADLAIPETPNWGIVSGCQAILKREGENYRIFDGDDTQKPSTNGIFINKKRITCSQGYLLTSGTLLEIGLDPNNCVKLTYIDPNVQQNSQQVTNRKLSFQNNSQWPIELGRETTPNRYASLQLPSPIVSRIHAKISQSSQGDYLIEDCSTNGTFVNGQKINQPVKLKDRDIIKIGPFTLIFNLQNLELEVFDSGQQIRLDADGLLIQYKDKKGKVITRLNKIFLPIEPGQLVALVGGSGTGKSTLLKTLLGIEHLDQGQVLLNNNDLRKNFNLYRSQIGYVSQDDIIHSNLKVEEVLQYACRLRLPPETDVNKQINRVLTQVKLTFVKNNLVSELSGGQRKRVSIAVELLADPHLFFLDEPTSGLDPGLDKEIMNLLKDLADQGRTIILVTHATANIEVCDRIAFLGRGGNLCYFGVPKEAMDFFKMPSQDIKYFPDIYLKLEQGINDEEVTKNVSYWADKFSQESPFHQSYMQSLKQRQAGNKVNPNSGNYINIINKISQEIQVFLSQLYWLSRRYLQLTLREVIGLTLAIATAPISIILITLTLRDKDPLMQLDPPEMSQAPLALRVLFIFTCAALWVGLSSSVQEIVKESSIYARERLVNLGLFSYLSSKILVRSGLAIIQTLLMVLVILIGFEPPESQLISWPIGLGITSFLTIISSLSFGLMISSFVKNETQANNTLPLILLPQIIFSGVLFKLEGIAGKFSWLMISRWSVGAYGILVDVNSMVPEAIKTPLGDTIERPFEPTSIYEPTWSNLTLNWLILVLHSLIYLLIALWFLKRKDQIKSSSN
jgi:ABC-type multidrug transport system ATPase subunit/pSer/pThr/pTyr-binding forkhead associated (FHA) protein